MIGPVLSQRRFFSLGLGRQVISTEGAFRRPLTYDGHPIHSNPNPLFALQRPEREKMPLKELGRPPMNQGELR